MPMHGPMMMDQPPQMPPQMPPPGALGQALTGGPPVEPEGQDPLTGMLVQLLADPEARAGRSDLGRHAAGRWDGRWDAGRDARGPGDGWHGWDAR
jgi:hypothetical protein